jgi:cytochrome c oxidase cbb3-type subunit III
MKRKVSASVKRFRRRRMTLHDEVAGSMFRAQLPVAGGARKAKDACLSAAMWVAASLAVAGGMPSGPWAQKSGSQAGEASAAETSGLMIFRTQCAACHGLDGRGGEHAPSIVQDPVKSLSDEDLTGIVHNGIPAKGMPEFSALGSAAIKSVVVYLRTIQGVSAPEIVTGNAAQGRSLFFGKGECSTCHVMDGTGSFIAADLSDFGQNHQPSQIRASILKTVKPGDSPAEQAAVTTRSGSELSGTVRSEDNFSLQIQNARGDFYLIMKSDVVRIRRAPLAAMPADYSKRLTPQEVDDLVSYIAKVSPQQSPAGSR